MTFDEYVQAATDHYMEGGRDYRFGQAAFNVLIHARPDIATQVKGSTVDPFFTTAGPRLTAFFEFVESRW